MTGRTHDLAAFTALNIAVSTQPMPQLTLSTALVSIVACFIGGLAPDIDNSTSEFWHKIPAGTIIGKLLHPFLGGHRLISHSILGLAVFSFGITYLLNLASSVLLTNMETVWWAFIIGLTSHLIMDSLTTEGVPWLFPLPIRFGFPPFRGLRIRTGGIVEKAFVFPALLMLNLYLFYKYYPLFRELFKQLIK